MNTKYQPLHNPVQLFEERHYESGGTGEVDMIYIFKSLQIL